MSMLEALGYVGDALAKPGRAVRGVLGGRPEEILAALPFSDTLGITDPAQQVRGRDLLNQLGVTDQADDGWGSMLGGLGVDIATDPLTYFGGALVRGALGSRAGIGAVEGSDAANGIFRLDDPIERLMTPQQLAEREAFNGSIGQTSPWAPLADELHPVPGVPDPPRFTPIGDEIPVEPPPPIRELFPADNAGYMLAHGPGYADIGERYGLAGPWQSSIPTEIAERDPLHAFALHTQEWGNTLGDLNRLSPEASASLGVPRATENFELDLADEIAQLSPHAAPWQQLLGLRESEVRAMAEMAKRNVLPGQFADDLGRQHELVESMIDRSVPPSPIMNAWERLSVGDIQPGQVEHFTRPHFPGDQAGPVYGLGEFSHLPVNADELARYAEAAQQERLLEEMSLNAERFIDQWGMTLDDFDNFQSRDVVRPLRDVLTPSGYRNMDPNIIARTVANPAEYSAGLSHHEDLIAQLRDALPVIEGRVANTRTASPAIHQFAREMMGTPVVPPFAPGADDILGRQARFDDLTRQLGIGREDAYIASMGTGEDDLQNLILRLARYGRDPT